MNFDRIEATELKNGKYRFEAVETNGAKHLIRKAGNLTKGVVQWNSGTFSFNIAEANDSRAVGLVARVYTPQNGIEVIAYEAK